MRAGKQGLVDELLPRLTISGEVMKSWSSGDKKILFSSLFPHDSTTPPLHDLWLEIGFGGGEHLAHQAALYPRVGIIGCEPYINGTGDLLKKISAQKLSNIRIHPDDARPLINALPDHSISRVFILYPDPWPKSRHHKRRIISKEFLGSIARVMKPGAELRLATDHSGYCTWMLERLLTHTAFKWTAKSCDDWLKPWTDWIPTRYEQKALAGMPTYLTFTRL